VPDLRINDHAYALDAPVGRTLAEALRDDLGLTGTKVACGEGHCTVGGRAVTTVEGLRDHPIVDAFVRADALQCGFCTPGQVVSASALLSANPSPTSDEVRHAMSGNLCRCGAYRGIEEAILEVAGSARSESAESER
jgi:xanthine dehydrogenase YagT iron-sulfur-binding subunit